MQTETAAIADARILQQMAGMMIETERLEGRGSEPQVALLQLTPHLNGLRR